MSQETTQPSLIDINPSDIRLDPLQQGQTLGSPQVNAYFHKQQLRSQQLQPQSQPQGMFILQQPMHGQFYGMNNFEDLLSQQSLNQNFVAMGLVDHTNSNIPYSNYPVQQQQQYPYDIQNLNLNNQNNTQNNINPQYISVPNNNNNNNNNHSNNYRNNVPSQQFFQLNDRQVDPIQIMNGQRQQQAHNSNHNYINNKDRNNGNNNNDKRNHRSQQHQYQPQQQQQYKSYQQGSNDHSQGNTPYQYNYHNNHIDINNNHQNTGNNNNQIYSNFPNQNYGNNHNHQRNNADNASKQSTSQSGMRYQPKYIPQEHSTTSANAHLQQPKYQPQGNQAQLEEVEDCQSLFQSQPVNPQQQQLPSDASKVHVSQLKVQLCQRKDKHERKKCQFYHSEEDRRRNPEKYIYSMNLCPNQGGKYSQGDHCPLGDDCPQAHNKVERLYHPLRYKAKFCKDFSERNSCSYGDYCSFAHEDSEIVIPMIDKLTQDAIFFMYFYKTVWCPNISEHVRGDCPYIHNVQDFRRDPKQYKLEPRQCEDWKKDNIKTYQQGRCQKQLDCDHCHGWKELSNHPMVYKTKPCNIPNCNQSNECVLYHSDSDKRIVTPELLAEEERIATAMMRQLFKGKTSYDVQLGAPFEAFFSEEELSKNNEPSSFHTNHNNSHNNNQTSSQQWSNNTSSNTTHGNQGNYQAKNNGTHRVKASNINGGYYPNKNNNNNIQANNLQFHNEAPPPPQPSSSSQYNQHHKHHQRGAQQQTYLPKSSYIQSQQQQMNVPQSQTGYMPRDQIQQFIKPQAETLGSTNPVDLKIANNQQLSNTPQLKPTAIKANSIISEIPSSNDHAISIKPAVAVSAGNSKEFSNFEVVTDDSTIASNQTDNNYFLNQLLLDSPPSSKTTTQDHPMATLNQSRSDNYSLPVSSKGQINFLTGIVRQTSERLVSPVQGLNSKSNLIETISGFNSSNSNIDKVSGYFQQSVHSGQGLSLIPPFSPHEQIESSHFQEIASAFSQNESSNTNSERAYSRDSSVSKEDISANTTLNRFNNSHAATPASNSAYSLVSQQQQQQQHQGNSNSSSSGMQMNKNLQQGSSLINCFNINSPPELSNPRKDSSYTGITATNTATTPLQTNFDQADIKATKQIDFFVTHGLSEEQIKMMSTSDIENLKFLNAGEKKALSTLADHYEFQDIQNLCNEAAKGDDSQNLD